MKAGEIIDRENSVEKRSEEGANGGIDGGHADKNQVAKLRDGVGLGRGVIRCVLRVNRFDFAYETNADHVDESPINIENADELRVFGIGKNDADHIQYPEEILV